MLINRNSFYKAVALTFVMIATLLCIAGVANAATVPDGHVGIRIAWGKAQNETLSPGWYFDLNPFHEYVIMNCRWQKYEMQTAAFSKDMQQVDIQCSMSYSLQADGALNMYKTVGEDYADKIMRPRFLDALKSTFAKYSAEELVANRESISYEVAALLADQLSIYSVYVRDVSIEDIDFTNAFTDAIEAKQVATQKLLQVQTEQQQLTLEKKAQAERDVIAAETALSVAKIEAEAVEYAGQKEAAANKAISESLTPELIDYYKIQKWNGKLPTVTAGGATPILNIGEVTDSVE